LIGLKHYSDREHLNSLKAFKSFIEARRERALAASEESLKTDGSLLIGTLSMNIS
jgi:hypothetical protein